MHIKMFETPNYIHLTCILSRMSASHSNLTDRDVSSSSSKYPLYEIQALVLGYELYITDVKHAMACQNYIGFMTTKADRDATIVCAQD